MIIALALIVALIAAYAVRWLWRATAIPTDFDEPSCSLITRTSPDPSPGRGRYYDAGEEGPGFISPPFQDISQWDVSQVTSLSNMFSQCDVNNIVSNRSRNLKAQLDRLEEQYIQ